MKFSNLVDKIGMNGKFWKLGREEKTLSNLAKKKRVQRCPCLYWKSSYLIMEELNLLIVDLNYHFTIR
jgi:hypothetical protein